MAGARGVRRRIRREVVRGIERVDWKKQRIVGSAEKIKAIDARSQVDAGSPREGDEAMRRIAREVLLVIDPP